MRSTLTVHELEAFLLVAETRNFRLAGERLHVSQPALSRTVQSAEHKLGARLLDRNTRRVDLTRAGEELLPIARRIVGEFHGSLSDLSEFMAGRRGRVTIAGLPSVVAALLPPAMVAFQAAYPGVTISLQTLSDEFVQEMVVDGRADFGISVAPASRSGVAFEPYARDEFVLICGRDDPLARRRRVDWQLLATRPLIASGPASSIRRLVDHVLEQTGITVEPSYESTHISVVGALVGAGLGVAPVPRLALRLIDMSRIVVLPLGRPALYRDIGILTRAGRSLSTAAASFLAALRAEGPGG
jgi:LysR family carnitine catabolism transcriptional activator